LILVGSDTSLCTPELQVDKPVLVVDAPSLHGAHEHGNLLSQSAFHRGPGLRLMTVI